MCQNNYIYCCFSFFHITWASTSASLDWMKGGLFREETHPTVRHPLFCGGCLGLSAWHELIVARPGICLLIAWGAEMFTLQMAYDVRDVIHLPTIPSTHVFFLTEGDVLWNVSSLLGSQSLKRNLVVALMKVSSFWIQVFSNASEVYF